MWLILRLQILEIQTAKCHIKYSLLKQLFDVFLVTNFHRETFKSCLERNFDNGSAVILRLSR